MSIFRSYFSKNNTIIKNNYTNNSQNPVTEISYGTEDKQVSRFIFDVDLTTLLSRINSGIYNSNAIVSHKLHMTNTISNHPQYLGKKSYLNTINRASSFDLEVFNIEQDWDEGSGYDFIYNDNEIYGLTQQACNWYSGKTNSSWNNEGIYYSGSSIINNQSFSKGDENIDIDVTDYINQIIFGTGYTGTTAFSGDTYGLGVKFTDYYENLNPILRQAVAFHTKNTNTVYDPYIETIFDDTIVDDRNYFYLDKDNYLYFYSNIGGIKQNVTINKVEIYDYEDNLLTTITGDSIINVSKGVYKILYNVSSIDYPDAVIFKDVWTVTINDKTYTHIGEFYLISQENYYTFNENTDINFNNYHFNLYGILEKENIVANELKKIKIDIKEFYSNQNNFKPLDIEYRLYTTLTNKFEIDIIPFTKVNRTNHGYEFNIDTYWLVPQEYYLQVRLKNGDYYKIMKTVQFNIISNKIM